MELLLVLLIYHDTGRRAQRQEGRKPPRAFFRRRGRTGEEGRAGAFFCGRRTACLCTEIHGRGGRSRGTREAWERRKWPGRSALRGSPVCPFRPHGSSVFSGRGGRLREAEGMLFFTSRSEHLMYGKLGLTFAPDTGKHTFFDCFRGRSLSACPVRNTMARSAPGGKASWLNIRKR